MFKEIPAFITTFTILMILILQPENLIYGLLGFLLSYGIYEMFNGRFIGGWGDIKVTTIISLMISSVNQFLSFSVIYTVVPLVIFFGIFGFHIIKRKKLPKEIPFIPILLVEYIVLLLIT